MGIQATDISRMIETELAQVSDSRVVDHIRSLMVSQYVVMRGWDYGEPGTEYPCWSVLEHEPSRTGIAYSEYGFGPSYPWGLVNLSGPDKYMSMGMDSAWYPCFVETYFESRASSELPVWRVFRSVDGSYPGEPITDESDWESTWEEVYRLRESNKDQRFNYHHSVEYSHPPE